MYPNRYLASGESHNVLPSMSLMVVGASLSAIFVLTSVVLYYIELCFILFAAGKLDSIDGTVYLL
jgi:hypothetical protein